MECNWDDYFIPKFFNIPETRLAAQAHLTEGNSGCKVRQRTLQNSPIYPESTRI
jgi:hypothetical protein